MKSTFARVFAIFLVSIPSMSALGAQINHPHIRWAVQTDGPIRGAPSLSEHEIYVGSSDGFVYAIEKAHGTVIWKFNTGGAIAGAPAIDGDKVIVAGRSQRVYALDRANGRVVWSFAMQPDLPTPTEWNFYTAPVVIDAEQVLVPSGDGFLYALNLENGALRWKFRTGDSLRAAPLVADGTIYQPSGDDYVYALTRDGKLRWKFATEGIKYDLSAGFIRSDIFSRPALQGRTLVFASRDANVYAVDIDTHQLKWKFAYDTTWAMSSAIDMNTVYVGWSINDKISALDLETGKLLWDFTTGAHTYTTALIDGDSSYWGCADGKIYSVDKQTGKLRWTYAVGAEIYSSPQSDADTLYFGTDDGRLLALSEATQPAAKAVYLPAQVPASLKSLIVDPSLTPYLIEHGYERLDSSEALQAWIAKHGHANDRSVIVFVFSLIPDAVLGKDPAAGPLRSYLDAGGKVVWASGAPNRYKFDASGQFLGFSAQTPRLLLGLDVLDFEDSGNYYARATQLGRNWGLANSLKTSYAVLNESAARDVLPLAIDEYGRVSAFVKSFVPRPGTGWISFSPSGFGVAMSAEQMQTLEHIASYTLE